MHVSLIDLSLFEDDKHGNDIDALVCKLNPYSICAKCKMNSPIKVLNRIYDHVLLYFLGKSTWYK